MGLKLAIFKTLLGATAAGVTAVAAQNAGKSKRKKGGCTPCKTMGALADARQAARTGKF